MVILCVYTFLVSLIRPYQIDYQQADYKINLGGREIAH